jgi:DNA-directed RNA polymerase specialized sigma24 family protein
MSKGVPTKEAFEQLLLWLNPDRENGAEKYEKIRFRLIRIFSCRGCCDAEDLADKTINVVMARIDWLVENYKGDPALYFYGVAKKIYLETLKQKPTPNLSPLIEDSEVEGKCGCLEDCLKQVLTAKERELVLRYHEKEKTQKIQLRKQLAAELGISQNALRIRVHHIHTRLRPCIEQCLQHLLVY